MEPTKWPENPTPEEREYIRIATAMKTEHVLRYLLDEAERYYAAEEDEGRALPHLKRACRIAETKLTELGIKR